MSHADLLRWEPRWQARSGPPGAPESFLQREAANLPCGRVLDLAAGDGRNALWLAAQGFEVTAVDIAPAATARLLEHAAARGLAVTALTLDLDDPEALTGLSGIRTSLTQHAEFFALPRPAKPAAEASPVPA